jgi:hypothetical protein
MNAWVLSNPLARFHRNEQKAIAKARSHALLKWDRLQVDLQYTLEVPKPTLVTLASSYIFWFLNMSSWDVGAIPLNV